MQRSLCQIFRWYSWSSNSTHSSLRDSWQYRHNFANPHHLEFKVSHNLIWYVCCKVHIYPLYTLVTLQTVPYSQLFVTPTDTIENSWQCITSCNSP